LDARVFCCTARELIDAARVDGCNTWQLFWKVMLPNAWMAITTMAVLFFVWTWNDFLLA
jgi:ABC-type glycerol-3-phosphate transport system permease component